MKRTFHGYLEGLIKQESGLDTLNLRRLVKLACSPQHPHLKEPLFLYALSRNKEYHLMSLVWNTPLEREYRFMKQLFYSTDSLREFFEHPQTPPAYLRIYQDYTAQKQTKASENPALERLRTRTVAALEKTDINRYQLCKALKLNPGNVYAYLAGNTSKVSVETAQRICDYVYERLS